MYENRSHLRNNEIKVRFDEDTIRAVRALAVLARKQPAAFVRDLALKEMRRQLAEASPNDTAIGSR